MKSLFISIAALLLTISVTACSSSSADSYSEPGENGLYGLWQDSETVPIQFELEQTFGDNEELMFPQIWWLQGPATDRSGNIYIIDGQNGTMYSFNSQGKKRWETGKEGKGPGDFERPRGLVTNGNFLYTANASGSRIDQFDLEGEFINSTSLEHLDLSFAKVVGFISDTLLVTTSPVMGEIAREITVLDVQNELNVVSQFKITSTSDVDIPQGFGSGFGIQIADTLIAAGNIEDYAIQFYNSNGKRVNTIRRDFDKLMRPGFTQSGSSRTIRGYGSLNPPIQLTNGYYLTTLNWPTNVNDPDDFLQKSQNNEDAPEVVYDNSMDLYDTEGTLLYTLEQEGISPKIGSISHVDEEGYIYTKSDEPFPQIRRYKVTIATPEE